jgi:hypothetical protein
MNSTSTTNKSFKMAGQSGGPIRPLKRETNDYVAVLGAGLEIQGVRNMEQQGLVVRTKQNYTSMSAIMSLGHSSVILLQESVIFFVWLCENLTYLCQM